MDTVLIVLSMFFGLIGMGMLSYGKRNEHIVFMGAGVLLMVVPYFIPSAIVLLIVGAGITLSPYYISV